MAELRPLNHTGTIRLETDRLILRPTSINDAEQMYNWASDPEVSKYLFWQPHADIEVTKGVLADWDKKNERLDYYHWGIVLKDTEQIIGAGGVVGGVDERHHSADLGYCLSRAYWGKGYMTEAISAMIAYLFNTVGLNRISASHDTDNVASGRVMQKCGMTFEGIRRQSHYCVRRGFYDSAYYAILKTDFEKNNKIAQ